MAGIKNIDRVRMQAQERLDLPDFNALLENADQGAQKTLGNLMGRGGGLLSPMPFTLTNDGVNFWIKPQAFSYYWSKRDKTASDGTYRSWLGGIGSYNPTAEGQQLLWNYTAAKAVAGIPTFMYARPKAVDTATDARRAHNGANELSVSLKTRTSVVHEFKFSTLHATDASNDGWAPVLVIYSWTPDIGSYALLSVWDSMSPTLFSEQPYTGVPTGPTTTGSLLTALANGTNPGDNEDIDGSAIMDRDLGIIQMFQQFKDRFYRHLDTAGSLQWVQDPPRNFVQLDADLTLAGLTLNAYHTRIVELEDARSYSWYVESSGVNYTATEFLTGGVDQSYYGAAPVFTRVSAGKVNVLYNLPTGAKLTGFSVQPGHRDSTQPVAANSTFSLSPTPGQDYLLTFTNVGGVYVDSSFSLTLHWIIP